MSFRPAFLLCLALSVSAAEHPVPLGYVVPAGTLSPRGNYGVTVPMTWAPERAGPDRNSVIECRTGRIVAPIRTDFVGFDSMNRGGVLPARWSEDGSLLLWEVEGRFSPAVLALVKLRKGKQVWQLDVLKTVQRATLRRTRAAAPRVYARAKQQLKGNGAAFPEGFNVNVRCEGDKERGGPGEDVRGLPVKLPLRVHAELTDDPKQNYFPDGVQLNASLDGVIDLAGQFSVTAFHLRRQPFENAEGTSWLEVTDPAAARHAPIEYGDVVSLIGTLTIQGGPGSEPGRIYTLRLRRNISVPAAEGAAAESEVSEIRLKGMEPLDTPAFGGRLVDGTSWEIDGTLGHAPPNENGPAITLQVHGFGSAPAADK